MSMAKPNFYFDAVDLQGFEKCYEKSLYPFFIATHDKEFNNASDEIKAEIERYYTIDSEGCRFLNVIFASKIENMRWFGYLVFPNGERERFDCFTYITRYEPKTDEYNKVVCIKTDKQTYVTTDELDKLRGKISRLSIRNNKKR